MEHIKKFIAQPPKNDAEACEQLKELLEPMYRDETKTIPERMAIRNLLTYFIEQTAPVHD